MSGENASFPELKIVDRIVDGKGKTSGYVVELSEMENSRDRLFPFPVPDDRNVYTCFEEELVSPFVVIPYFLEDGEAREGDVLDLEKFKVVPGYFIAAADALRRYVSSKGRFDPIPWLNGLYGSTRVYLVTFKSGGKLRGFKFQVFEKYQPFNELEAVFLRRKVVYPREKVPESVRLPHPSHRGRVDLFETPESEKIGLVLSMCEGAEYDPENLTIKKGGAFSLATLQIPFLFHSDGARISMGSKNLKQYMPLLNAEDPILKTPHSLKMGVNALVVYMLYKGLNFEDGVVVSKSFADKLFTRVVEEHPVLVNAVLPEEFEVSPNGEEVVFRWKASRPSSGCIESVKTVLKIKKGRGSWVSKGNVLMELETRVSVRDVGEFLVESRAYRYDGYYKGKVLDVKLARDVMFPQKFETKEAFKSKMLSPSTDEEKREFLKNYFDAYRSFFEVVFELEVEKPLRIGDKLMGRYGNKGVVSRIVPDDEMPKVLMNGEWKTAEVILSPLGVVSRMNLGQLYETQITPLIKEGLWKKSEYDPTEVVDDQARSEILNLLKGIGADDFGRFEVMFDGARIRALAGYQYLVRLDHCSGDKIHAIADEAPTSPITFQPFKGRRKKGGQRFGEMEFWTLLDHNAFDVLELFRECNRKGLNVTEKLNAFLNVIFSNAVGISYKIDGERVTFLKASNDNKKELSDEQRAFLNHILGKKELMKERLKTFVFEKEGYIRSVIVGRRLFFSGRAVIVPCPELDPDEVLLPAEFGRVFFKRPNASIETLNELAKGKFVLLNRQPSLHKHNILAFRFRFWDEWVIGFPILACKGFNADFDGDTMAVYFLVEQDGETSKALEKMTLRENPFLFGSGELALSVDQDFAYGLYLMGFGDKKKSQKALREMILNGKWEEAIALCRKALDTATRENLTLTIYEIEKDAESFEKIKKSKSRGSDEQYRQLNGSIQYGDVTLKGNFLKGVDREDYLNFISERSRKSLMDKKLHVAEAGDFTRFLVEIAGHVKLEEEGNEGVLVYDVGMVKWLINHDLLERALWGRYDVDLGRYLTDSDLEQIRANPRAVKIFSPVAGPVTKKSFGLDPSTGRELETKYIGVACAHSVGERGTQLSMQTFHTGSSGKPFQMSKVEKYVKNVARSSRDFIEFVKELVELKRPESIEIVDMMNLHGKKRGIFEYLSVQFALLEVLYRPLKEEDPFDYVSRGPLTVMSYQRGYNVLEKLKKESKDSTFKEKHPRTFFFGAYRL